MARKRTPCAFCQDDMYSEYVEHHNGYCIWYEAYPFNNLLAFIAQANDENGEMIEDSIQIQMNFCPVCGRDLTKEA